MNTLEEIKQMFPTEEDCRKYLVNLRWGKFARCPYCGNYRAYFIENGTRYKCADKNCKKKFSVTVKTLMEATKLPLTTWFKCIRIFANKNLQLNVWDIEKEFPDLDKRTVGLIKEKLDFVKPYVLTDGRTDIQIFEDILKSMFNLGDKINIPKYNYILKDVSDISKVSQYENCIQYSKFWLRTSYWITADIGTPEDFVAEAFIKMSEDRVKEYDADLVAYYIRKVTQKMWMDWVKEHPEAHEYLRAYHKEWHRKQRINVTPYYVKSKAKRVHKDMAYSEIEADKKIMRDRKEKILEFRKRYNLLEGFNSHFE